MIGFGGLFSARAAAQAEREKRKVAEFARIERMNAKCDQSTATDRYIAANYERTADQPARGGCGVTFANEGEVIFNAMPHENQEEILKAIATRWYGLEVRAYGKWMPNNVPHLRPNYAYRITIDPPQASDGRSLRELNLQLGDQVQLVGWQHGEKALLWEKFTYEDGGFLQWVLEQPLKEGMEPLFIVLSRVQEATP